MATVLLVISAVLFIATFGIHMFIIQGNKFDQPMYTRNPIMSIIPLISGFILPVIPLAFVINLHWALIFVINLVVVLIIGPTLTKAILVRFASGKGLGQDMLYVFIAGLIAMGVGFAIR